MNGRSVKSSSVKDMRVYACDVQSKAVQNVPLSFFCSPSESMAYSKVVMICEISDESCVLNSHVDGGESVPYEHW
jgi:hypothetical protein